MQTSDVVIIGAGLMGCAAALRLRQGGLSVTLVERGIPGAEASSAAAGILAPQVEADGPGPFLSLALRSRELYPGFIAELFETTGIDIGYRREGTLVVAHSEDDAESLKRRHAWQRGAGLRSELLTDAGLRDLEPALASCVAAVHLPDDHQVEAAQLSRALAQGAAQAGARFHSAHVQRVLIEDGRARGVIVEGETLWAGHVILAAGSWSSLVAGSGLPERAVRPMRGQMLELDTRPPLLRHVVFGHLGAGAARVGGYLVPRRDGRVVAGSTMELVGFRKEVTVDGLARLLRLVSGVCPALGGAEVRRTWAGFRPYTNDGLPLLGATGVAGLSLCTGHFRNGVLLTPISAEALYAAVTGTWRVPPVDLAPFSVTRLPKDADQRV